MKRAVATARNLSWSHEGVVACHPNKHHDTQFADAVASLYNRTFYPFSEPAPDELTVGVKNYSQEGGKTYRLWHNSHMDSHNPDERKTSIYREIHTNAEGEIVSVEEGLWQTVNGLYYSEHRHCKINHRGEPSTYRTLTVGYPRSAVLARVTSYKWG